MRKEQALITNKLGLHARAAARVVHTANRFKSSILIGVDDEEVNAKSILGLLTLAATKGTTVTVRAEGEDENDAVAAVVQLIADKFGEEE
jgi:Phosphotransferase System HPr (HPr) Family